MSKGSIKLAIFGLGRIFTMVHYPQLKRVKGLDVIFISDLDSKKTRLWQKKLKLKNDSSLLELAKCTHCMITAPIGNRVAIFDQLLECKKLGIGKLHSIFIEKPIELSGPEGFFLSQLRIDHQVSVYVNLQKAFKPGLQTYSQVISNEIRKNSIESIEIVDGVKFRWEPMSKSFFLHQKPWKGVVADRLPHALSVLIKIVSFQTISIVNAFFETDLGPENDASISGFIKMTDYNSVPLNISISRLRNLGDCLSLRFSNGKILSLGIFTDYCIMTSDGKRELMSVTAADQSDEETIRAWLNGEENSDLYKPVFDVIDDIYAVAQKKDFPWGDNV